MGAGLLGQGQGYRFATQLERNIGTSGTEESGCELYPRGRGTVLPFGFLRDGAPEGVYSAGLESMPTAATGRSDEGKANMHNTATPTPTPCWQNASVLALRKKPGRNLGELR